jgi:hypothetical protein
VTTKPWRGISLTARPAMGRVRDSYAFGLKRLEMELARSMYEEMAVKVGFHVLASHVVAFCPCRCSAFSSHFEKGGGLGGRIWITYRASSLVS